MASHRDPRAVYRDLVTHWTGERHRLNLKKNRIGWGRLASVVLALTGLFTLWSPGWYLAIGAFTLGMAAFLRLVARDVKVSADLHQAELMLAINQEELRILDHQFADREDGSRWMETDHPYAADLDILGRSSLYQVLNRTTSEQGGAQLARWLLHPADGREILHRQEAIGELSPLTEWRQKFQAAGMSVRMTTGTQQRLEHWIQQEDPFTRRPAWHWIRWVEPAVMGLLVAGYLASVIPGPLFWGLAFLFFLLTGSFSRRITTLYTQLGRVAPELATLSRSAHLMETPGFRSPMLRDLQQPFMVSGQRASVAIGELKSILDRFDLRQNPAVFFILNTL
ncbi:MAG TPA: hypothetical protein VG870_06275, partial [Chitinophagaceae bacterium]|nr:hypothetical protein [Chitinophagaceae bacterium]